MARFILLLSGVGIAVIAIPVYFLMCVWIDIFEKHINKKKGEKDDV